ncbi:hypothetical protein DFH07DRAFT_970881 [Mycena maculata]|uniref:F-box domain-containing protein n=1 Tax=Mycena maculata TaxID=230809 RepID=A0AAD7MNY0_9AGAR|nr:hypothetical protein DFH07DRAFT_970881 [Mycena maculata]
MFPLPPEIIARIIEQLSDSKSDLLSCSLICRGWLPFARNNLEIYIHPHSSSTFIELLASPTNTLGTTLRHLDLLNLNGLLRGPLYQVLTMLSSLRYLALWATVGVELPALPWLTRLSLCGTEFASYSGFATFMSNLPALQNLEFMHVTWAAGPDDDQYTFPTLDLLSLYLYWGPTQPIRTILFGLRTRNLVLDFPS